MTDTSTEAVTALLAERDAAIARPTHIIHINRSHASDAGVIEAMDALLAERDRLAAQVVQLQRDLDTANARADEVLNALQSWQSIAHNCTITSGVCCCGDNMDGHSEPVVCGHVPRDHGEYMSSLELVRTSAILTALEKPHD